MKTFDWSGACSEENIPKNQFWLFNRAWFDQDWDHKVTELTTKWNKSVSAASETSKFCLKVKRCWKISNYVSFVSHISWRFQLLCPRPVFPLEYLVVIVQMSNWGFWEWQPDIPQFRPCITVVGIAYFKY